MLTQTGGGNAIWGTQGGTGDTATVTQNGNSNLAVYSQVGMGNHRRSTSDHCAGGARLPRPISAMQHQMRAGDFDPNC